MTHSHYFDGPIRDGKITVSTLGASRVEHQFISNYGSDWGEERFLIDWHEQHALLRLPIEHHCPTPQVRYEIPYASIDRSVGSEEWPGQSWVVVSDIATGGGIAIVTDSKSSISVDDSNIYITAARSPLYAHHVPPHVIKPHERLRYQDQGEQEFRILHLPFEGDWLSLIHI